MTELNLTDNDSPTWDAIRDRINGLWPRWRPTDAERELTVRRLSGLRMRWLDAAVESYRVASDSTVFRLAELLEHYRRISTAGEQRDAASGAATREPTPAQKAAQWQRERERDHVAALAFLRGIDRAEVARIVGELRAAGWIGAEPLPPKFEDWTVSTCLIVHARFTLGYTVRVAGCDRPRQPMPPRESSNV